MLTIRTSVRPARSVSASAKSRTNFDSEAWGAPTGPPRRLILYGMTTQSKQAPTTPLALSATAATRPATWEPCSVPRSASIARTEVVRYAGVPESKFLPVSSFDFSSMCSVSNSLSMIATRVLASPRAMSQAAGKLVIVQCQFHARGELPGGHRSRLR